MTTCSGTLLGRAWRVGFERRLGLPLALAACVVTAIQQDAVNPGRQAGVELDGAGGAVYLQKGFLHSVLGVCAIRKQMKRNTFHTPGMRRVDLLERGEIPAFGCLNEIGAAAGRQAAGGHCQGHSDWYNAGEGGMVLKIFS